jgi:hypothetical protein
MNLYGWFGSFLVVGLFYSLDARASSIDCEGLLVCTSVDNKESCCPVDRGCDPTGGCLPEGPKPTCGSSGTCETFCNSNFDCNGSICTYDEESQTNLCTPKIIEDESPEFTCAFRHMTPAHNAPAAFVCLALVLGFRGRYRRQSEE